MIYVKCSFNRVASKIYIYVAHAYAIVKTSIMFEVYSSTVNLRISARGAYFKFKRRREVLIANLGEDGGDYSTGGA